MGATHAKGKPRLSGEAGGVEQPSVSVHCCGRSRSLVTGSGDTLALSLSTTSMSNRFAFPVATRFNRNRQMSANVRTSFRQSWAGQSGQANMTYVFTSILYSR